MTKPDKTETKQLDLESLVTADVIVAVYAGKEYVLWKRPQAEVAARGFPVKVRVVKVPLSSRPQLRELQAKVDQLKHGD